ncbi:hypothetical protein CERZMDRAFT_43011 [Cercospora zeae-maydis SCOH1-5]|uniref:Uncharacterized protein n=1 Tax=Cercospora zeae-maydis SCOH1-5 TaxID=717836 RepID=A0A6A6FDN5_9PEZI|nr:hypothetical protein CERZMDRAFT_43011 [Cercospora zeae-maydis SCOH1-5]
MNGSCGFHIKASGGLDCTMGQFQDGQNRLNGSYPVATYYFENGGITDGHGRPCIVTTTNDATHQFQCDENSPGGPTRGFTISSDRTISYNGNPQFFACKYINEYNVYTQKLENQENCLPVELSADDDCAAGSSGPVVVTPSSPASSTASSTTPVSPVPTTPGACDKTSLEGSYLTPELITWVSEAHPATPYGSKQNATINDECSSVFNFNIPADYKGKQCSVVFLFPEDESNWSWNNKGSIEFNELSGAVTAQTTYDTSPSKKQCLGSIAPQPGNSYVVSTAPCQAGETVTIETSSTDDLGMDFCEDANKPPVGVYITAC